MPSSLPNLSTSTPRVSLYTDGACSGNPGPGGWAWILEQGSTVSSGSGFERHTTNNRMELLAAVEGLRSLIGPHAVEVVSDSQYLVKGLNEWIDGWKKRGWKRKEGALLNADLWRDLDQLRAHHSIHCRWIRGHTEHPQNTECDRLAVAAIQSAM
ncbi:MAG: ribonuclease HI [Phycisphaerales bacterium]|nr:ribonuclease HI [Phycisphaerales bacterium]